MSKKTTSIETLLSAAEPKLAAYQRQATGRGQIDFPDLNEEALPYLDEILEDLLDLDTKHEGHEILMLNPLRNDGDFGSFKINDETGRWAEFAEYDEGCSGGDVTSLVAYLLKLNQGKAAQILKAYLATLDTGASA